MNIDDWTTRERWLYAIKPASWPKLLVPMALGAAVGIYLTGSVNLAALAFAAVFTVLDGLFIVLMNDWGDQEVDRIKRQMFPDGCSPKTIPDGVLPARHVLIAGLAAGAGAVALSFVAGSVLARPHLGWLGVACVATFVAYTLPPLRLNYRGGGELLEMLGVGVMLPWFAAYAQSGNLLAAPYELFGGFAVLSLGSALASGLSDEESDRRGGKRTFTTMAGNKLVRRSTELAVAGGAILWLFAGFRGVVPLWAVIPAVVLATVHRVRMKRVSDRAITNAFGPLKQYKLHLHNAIWHGGLALAAALLLDYLVR